MKQNKPHLPVDLMIVNTQDHNIAQKTLAYCAKFFEFNNIIMISDTKINYENFTSIKIDRFENIHGYSDFCLRLIDYVESDHLLLVQDDGHIINPSLWDENFLNYDYIGAPWPTSNNWLKRFKKYDNDVYKVLKSNIKQNRVGNGGFSLRSSKFLEFTVSLISASKLDPISLSDLFFSISLFASCFISNSLDHFSSSLLFCQFFGISTKYSS